MRHFFFAQSRSDCNKHSLLPLSRLLRCGCSRQDVTCPLFDESKPWVESCCKLISTAFAFRHQGVKNPKPRFL